MVNSSRVGPINANFHWTNWRALSSVFDVAQIIYRIIVRAWRSSIECLYKSSTLSQKGGEKSRSGWKKSENFLLLCNDVDWFGLFARSVTLENFSFVNLPLEWSEGKAGTVYWSSIEVVALISTSNKWRWSWRKNLCLCNRSGSKAEHPQSKVLMLSNCSALVINSHFSALIVSMTNV